MLRWLKIANDDMRREQLRRTMTQDINEMNVVLDNTKEALQGINNELDYLMKETDNPRYGGYLATYVETSLTESREGIEDLLRFQRHRQVITWKVSQTVERRCHTS